jgi:hypothetical protein
MTLGHLVALLACFAFLWWVFRRHPDDVDWL